MKMGCFISSYRNNEIFSNLIDEKKNRDGYFCSLYVLRQKLYHAGVDLSTHDIISQECADFILFENVNSDANLLKKLNYFSAMESDIVRPKDFMVENHANFHRVFTWSDDLVVKDPNKYIKQNYSFCFPEDVKIGIDGREKLCTMIAGNKMIYRPTELYSKRLEAVEWFEKNHPEDFDLYGIQWDEFYIRSNVKIFRALNRLKFFKKLLKPNRPSYCGTVVTKKNILEKYKFSICYENSVANGYITEKIFDCFFAGCVPIYLGAPNILSHIPSGCFIDKRSFKTYSELYEYIDNMPSDEYLKYQNQIVDFLKSAKGYEFSAERNAEIWIEALKKDGII